MFFEKNFSIEVNLQKLKFRFILSKFDFCDFDFFNFWRFAFALSSASDSTMQVRQSPPDKGQIPSTALFNDAEIPTKYAGIIPGTSGSNGYVEYAIA